MNAIYLQTWMLAISKKLKINSVEKSVTEAHEFIYCFILL